MRIGEWRVGSDWGSRNRPTGDYEPKIHHRNSNNRIIQRFAGLRSIFRAIRRPRAWEPTRNPLILLADAIITGNRQSGT